MTDTRIAAIHALIADDDDLYALAIDRLTDSLDDDTAEFNSPLAAMLLAMIDAVADDPDLYYSFEFCPVHHCDWQICRDDDLPLTDCDPR